MMLGRSDPLFCGRPSSAVTQKSFSIRVTGSCRWRLAIIELLRRLGRIGHPAWAAPLPLFAIIGGLMLFGHSHGGSSLSSQDRD